MNHLMENRIVLELLINLSEIVFYNDDKKKNHFITIIVIILIDYLIINNFKSLIKFNKVLARVSVV